MAIGVEQLKSNDVQYQSNSIGSVIDVSFLQSLKLKTWKDQPAFEKAINDWAEKQIDDQSELRLMKAIINNPEGVDAYFDDQLVQDFKNDIDWLKTLLLNYVESTSGFQNEIHGLSNAIKFQLTAEWQHKVNSIMGDQSHIDGFYTLGGTYPTQNITSSTNNSFSNIQSNNSINQNITSSWTPKSYKDVTWSGVGNNFDTPIFSPNIPNSSKEKLIPDDTVWYSYQNIYTTNKESVKDSSNWSERRVLRNWIKGNKEWFLDIIETSGDNKINKPDSAEKALLTEYFKRPLKKLVLNRDNNLENVWNIMVKAVNEADTKWSKIWGIGSEQQNQAYWENNIPEWRDTSSGLFKDGKKIVIEQMAKLSALYISWRDKKIGGIKSWSYTDRLLAMVNNTNNADKLYSFSDSSDLKLADVDNEFKSITDRNNDNTGTTELWWHKLFTKQSKDNAAVRELESIVSWEAADYLDDSSVTVSKLKTILNAGITGRIPVTDVELRSILKQHKWLTDLFNSAKEATDKNYTPNLNMMLAEGKAFGASAVDTYNIKAIAEFATVDEAKRGPVSDATRFVNFLADYDHNGNAGGPADHGVNGWWQILANYRFAVNELKHQWNGFTKEQAEDQIGKNILQYMINTSARTGDYYPAEVLKQYQGGGKTFVDIAKDHPWLIKYMQNILKNTSEKINHIMLSDKWSLNNSRKLEQQSIASTLQGTVDSYLAGLPESERATTKAAIEAKAKASYDTLRQQISKLDTDQQSYFDYISLPLLEQHIAHTVSTSLNANPWALGVWLGVRIVDGIQLNLSVASWPDFIPVPWVGIGFSNKNDSLWLNMNMSLLGPNASGYARLAQRKWDTAKLANTLTAYNKTTNSIWLHGGYGMTWVSGWLWYQQEIDRMGGISETATNIQKELSGFLPKLLNSDSMFNRIMSIDSAVKKDNYLQDLTLESNRNKAKDPIRSLLMKQYPNEKSEMYEEATNTLFDAIIQTQYDGSPEGIQKIANHLSEQWKEAQVNELKNKTKITGRGVGIHAFVSPASIAIISPVSFRLSKYNAGYAHHDTSESLSGLYQAQEVGKWNREVTMSVAQRIDYVNDMVMAARGMVDISQQHSLPKLTASEDGKFIIIPKALYQNDAINIKISPTMAGRIAEQGKNLIIPVDAPLRFHTAIESQKAAYVLNIWSPVTSGNDLHLLRFRDDLLSTKQLDGKNWFVDPEAITVWSTNRVEGINTDDLKNKLTAWWVRIATVRIEWNILVYTTTDNATEQKVSINGGKIWDVTLSVGTAWLQLTRTTALWTQKESLAGVVSYDVLDNTKNLIEGLSIIDYAKLEKFEKTPQLNSFLSALIDNNDSAALSALRWLDIPELQSAINNANDILSQWEISAYMAQAFALEPEYKTYKSALTLMAVRDKGSKTPAFERIEGKDSRISSFLNRAMFESAYANLSARVGEPSLSDKSENIIGYTAFYRKNAKGSSRGYAMTVPWYTNILWWKDNVNTFDSSKAQLAKEWFYDKIEHDTFARDSIIKWLQKNVSSDLRPFVAKLTTGELIKVLNGEKVSLGGLCDLKVDTTPVFYLLAECANESIWLKINVVTCTDQNGKEISRVDGNLIKEYNTWPMTLSVANTTWSVVLGKTNVISFAMAPGWKIDTKARSGGIKEGDVITNPGWWPKDDGSGTWTWPGWDTWDTWDNNTWWG